MHPAASWLALKLSYGLPFNGLLKEPRAFGEFKILLPECSSGARMAPFKLPDSSNSTEIKLTGNLEKLLSCQVGSKRSAFQTACVLKKIIKTSENSN